MAEIGADDEDVAFVREVGSEETAVFLFGGGGCGTDEYWDQRRHLSPGGTGLGGKEMVDIRQMHLERMFILVVFEG